MQAEPLSEADLDRIFTTRIVPDIFAGARPEATPLLVLVGAQPGAGKTRAGEDVIRESGRPVIPIIGDDLRVYHPAYRRTLERAPLEMPAVTAAASAAWVERSIEYAAQNRISVLVEGTFRNPNVTVGTARRFKDAGFRVQAVLVAVAPEMSHVSIARRFVQDERSTGSARFTSLEAHEAAVRAIPATMRALCAGASPVDTVQVRTRDRVLFIGERHGQHAIRGALAAARGERNRPLDDTEFEQWSAHAADAAEYLAHHHGHDPEVQDLIAQLGVDRRYIDLSRSGEVPVRGHVRSGHVVEPYTRSRPAR